MKCAIMQPTYIPWAGYFNLISKADVFVFLDDAQYERSSWQNRNKVVTAGAAHWITIPVMREFLGAAINSVRTDEKLPWRRKHLALLKQVYAGHPYGAEALRLADLIADPAIDVLAELNIRIIRECCACLGIETPLARSSEMSIEGQRTERLIKICERLDCDQYLSPPGANEYLAEDQFEKMTSIRLSINDFIPQTYPQKGTKQFISHLSIVDVAANIGWKEAAVYVRNSASGTAAESSHE
jgi:WbqC-like protein family